MDPHIQDYLRHLHDTHLNVALLSDMDCLADALDIPVIEAERSFARPDGLIHIRRTANRLDRRADLAHEIVHVLANRAGFTKKFRRFHASAPNLKAHEELLTEHGADALLMPDILVREVFEHCGYTAHAVYELSRFAHVSPEQALRRTVFLDPTAYAAGFVVNRSHVVHIEFTRRSPVWYMQRLPEPTVTFPEGLTLHPLPGRPGRLLGLFDLAAAGD